MRRRAAIALIITIALSLTLPVRAFGAASAPAQNAEAVRAALVQAQINLSTDPESATHLLAQARTVYQTSFSRMIHSADVSADARVLAGLEAMQAALMASDAPAFAAARAQTWTAILAGSYAVVEQAIQHGDGATAQAWLGVREFRAATRFARPGAEATLAVEQLAHQQLSPEQTLLAVRADVLDTYQARLTKALNDLRAAQANGFSTRLAEHAALAEGYFALLAPAYEEQRGAGDRQGISRSFRALRDAAVAGQDVTPTLTAIETNLQNFRAAPLSPEEQARRAGQLLRYLALVPVEYARGVKNGVVTRDIEIQEAVTFRSGAAAAFADLRSLLDERDPAGTAQAAELLAALETQLTAATAQTNVPAPDAVQANATQLLQLLKSRMPAEWQQASAAGDFDVIASLLDQMENAARAGQYDLAESARLEAYAVMETGPEARLMVFAPQLKLELEGLFWNGQAEHKGLAYLIKNHAPLTELATSRAALDRALAKAQTMLAVRSAPAAVAVNSGVIVFREGLEAVLILASLMSSLMGAHRRLRRPLWLGALAALAATVLTWLLAQGVLMALARYGETLEAVVSLIAIGVLLLITNWFFHKVYWTGWIASFHAQKKRLISGEAGLWLGLIALGFTSIYREGFETVLFLQALVLESGAVVVLIGVAAGLAAVLVIGALTFKWQANLPHKKMLIVTGILIGVVLLVMVGNTTHVLQVVGWLPIHTIPELPLPYWTGLWFGLYPTWEGLLLQTAAATFVIGSYYLAENMKKRDASPTVAQQV